MKDKSIKWAVIEYLKNRGDKFEDKDIVIEPLGQNSVVDAIYKKTNEKFQIKRIPKNEIAVVEILDKRDKTKQGNYEGEWIDYGDGLERVKRWTATVNPTIELIQEPINDLIEKYGPNNKNLNDTICVLHIKEGVFPGSLPGLENVRNVNQTGFKEIYIVDHKSNIKIH